MAFPTPLWSSLPTNPMNPTPSSASSRPVTRDGATSAQSSHPPPTPTLLTKDRERKSATYARRSSFSSQRRRGSSAAPPPDAVVTDATAPPALPYYALAAAAKVASQQAREQEAALSGEPIQSPSFPDTPGDGWGSRMLSRTTTNTSTGDRPPTTPGGSLPVSGGFWAQHEAQAVHQQVVDLATKRINFLDYLRKVHEGRRYWFNTYLFDKPDLVRMPLFDPRKVSRKATNYLLLGLSLPVVVDLYSANAQEFLRSLNLLLAEFDSFQQLHNDSASRNRLPNMFRRPGVKSRRSTSNTDVHSVAEDSLGGPSPGGLNTAPASVMNFAASESDLLPGEEYTHLLTPALPFEPDYFETFATLCDVLIDCYTRLINLMPTPRECSSSLAEQFSKMDSKIKKLIFQNVVKEFEDNSRASLKTEVASIGKVVLSGLM